MWGNSSTNGGLLLFCWIPRQGNLLFFCGDPIPLGLLNVKMAKQNWSSRLIWRFPSMGIPKMDFIIENPIKIDDLGIPAF